jgi:hypothetical protein
MAMRQIPRGIQLETAKNLILGPFSDPFQRSGQTQSKPVKPLSLATRADAANFSASTPRKGNPQQFGIVCPAPVLRFWLASNGKRRGIGRAGGHSMAWSGAQYIGKYR